MTTRVELTINGRAYGIGCEEGEEEKLRQLAKMLDDTMAQIIAAVGHQPSNAQVMFMAAMELAHDLSKAYEKIKNMENAAAALKAERTNDEKHVSWQTEAMLAAIDGAGEKLRGLTARIRQNNGLEDIDESSNESADEGRAENAS